MRGDPLSSNSLGSEYRNSCNQVLAYRPDGSVRGGSPRQCHGKLTRKPKAGILTAALSVRRLSSAMPSTSPRKRNQWVLTPAPEKGWSLTRALPISGALTSLREKASHTRTSYASGVREPGNLVPRTEQLDWVHVRGEYQQTDFF